MMDRLTWSELALDQLAELWLASQNRAASIGRSIASSENFNIERQSRSGTCLRVCFDMLFHRYRFFFPLMKPRTSS